MFVGVLLPLVWLLVARLPRSSIVRLPCLCWSWWLVSLPLRVLVLWISRAAVVGCWGWFVSCPLWWRFFCCRWGCLPYCHGWRLWLFPFFGWVLLLLLVWRLGFFLWCAGYCRAFGCCVPACCGRSVAVTVRGWCSSGGGGVAVGGVVCCWRLLVLVFPVLAAVLLCSLAAVLLSCIVSVWGCWSWWLAVPSLGVCHLRAVSVWAVGFSYS